MNDYLIRMWNWRDQWADRMYVSAPNISTARELAVKRLYDEWDDPENWILYDLQKIF